MSGTTAIIEKDDELLAAISGIIKTPQVFAFDNFPNPVRADRVAKEQNTDAQPTNQQPTTDLIAGIAAGTDIICPVDILASRKLKDISPHHASCIQSKKYSIMGLGFVSEGSEVQQTRNNATTPVDQVQQQVSSLLQGEAYVETAADKLLDPLTMFGFSYDLYRVVEDFLDGGTGYLEVVRDDANAIVGLNWLPAENIIATIAKADNNRNRLVFKYTGGLLNAAARYYAMFGVANRDWVHSKFYSGTSGITPQMVSEVIPFMAPSNQSQYYGYPDWLSSWAFINLLMRALQYKSDFYVNRGVLAYVLSIIGAIDGDKWKQIEKMVQGSVGEGNNFRNLAVNLPNKDSKVQLDKLASSDRTEEQFARDSEVFGLNIVSAHRVPPVLANILISGKLGAANETVQALIAFQLLVVGPYQNLFQRILAKTLANGKEGVKGLKPEDLRFRKITSQFNIQGLDTASRMRQEAPGAKNPDGTPRNVQDGLKD